jgi:HPt (histidine-containing phosphotransfer) domain-containing protein
LYEPACRAGADGAGGGAVRNSALPMADRPDPRPDPRSGAAGALLDAAALDQLRQLDPDGRRGFVAQVLQTYHGSLERHLATLVQARSDRASQRVGEVVHTLKSSSASVGATEFARLCAAVERQVRDGDEGALDAPLQALLHEGERVLAAVRAMLPP